MKRKPGNYIPNYVNVIEPKTARLCQLRGLVASLRDGATYFPRNFESKQGKIVALGSNKIESPSQAGSIAKRTFFAPGYFILKYKKS